MLSYSLSICDVCPPRKKFSLGPSQNLIPEMTLLSSTIYFLFYFYAWILRVQKRQCRINVKKMKNSLQWVDKCISFICFRKVFYLLLTIVLSGASRLQTTAELEKFQNLIGSSKIIRESVIWMHCYLFHTKAALVETVTIILGQITSNSQQHCCGVRLRDRLPNFELYRIPIIFPTPYLPLSLIWGGDRGCIGIWG